MDTENKKEFGDFIRKIRLEDPRELTLKDVSDELGISLSLLSDIEKGRRKPFDSEKIEKFCELFRLDDDEKDMMYAQAALYAEEMPPEDSISIANVGDLAKIALRLTGQGLASKEDWRDFIDRLEKNKGG